MNIVNGSIERIERILNTCTLSAKLHSGVCILAAQISGKKGDSIACKLIVVLSKFNSVSERRFSLIIHHKAILYSNSCAVCTVHRVPFGGKINRNRNRNIKHHAPDRPSNFHKGLLSGALPSICLMLKRGGQPRSWVWLCSVLRGEERQLPPVRPKRRRAHCTHRHHVCLSPHKRHSNPAGLSYNTKQRAARHSIVCPNSFVQMKLQLSSELLQPMAHLVLVDRGGHQAVFVQHFQFCKALVDLDFPRGAARKPE